jgi:integrase
VVECVLDREQSASNEDEAASHCGKRCSYKNESPKPADERHQRTDCCQTCETYCDEYQRIANGFDATELVDPLFEESEHSPNGFAERLDEAGSLSDLLEHGHSERPRRSLVRSRACQCAREGELLAIRWRDVDWTRGAIKIQRTLLRMSSGLSFAEPKTASSRRTITLGASTMKALQRHRVGQAEERLRHRLGKATDDDLVFATAVGTPIDAGNFLANTHYPLLKRLGLPRVRFHDLRHTAATLLLEAGAHPRVVAERLGHATPALVMNVYGHVSPTMQKDATAALERVLGA